jgi:hypothetical protein
MLTPPEFTAEFSLKEDHRVALPQVAMSRHKKTSIATGRSVKMASGIPIYGNWCGPGHGGESGPPIDPVDQVCCRHDKCYDQIGYFACSCNQDLLNALPLAMANPMTPPEGVFAGLEMMAAFDNLPCLCYICPPFGGCLPVAPGITGLPLCPWPSS